MNEEREKLQDFIRELVVLNTDIGEAITDFKYRFKKLKEETNNLYMEIDGRIENM